MGSLFCVVVFVTAAWTFHQMLPGSKWPPQCPVLTTLLCLYSWSQGTPPLSPVTQPRSLPSPCPLPAPHHQVLTPLIYWGDHTPSQLQAASTCHQLLQYSPDRSPFFVCHHPPRSWGPDPASLLYKPSIWPHPRLSHKWSPPNSGLAHHLVFERAGARVTESL